VCKKYIGFLVIVERLFRYIGKSGNININIQKQKTMKKSIEQEIRELAEQIQTLSNLGVGYVVGMKPYSQSRNPIMFGMLGGMWDNGLVDRTRCVGITKECFESRLANDELRNEYVELMDRGCTYWLSVENEGRWNYETLFMANGNKLVMWFIDYGVKPKE
jgi:hypothetical protein